MTDELDSVIPSHVVLPFPQVHAEKFENVTVLRRALVACPICWATDNFYDISKKRLFNCLYCEGNKPAEEICKDVIGREHSHPVFCAGIIEKHFHVGCRVCGNIFFLGMPEVSNG